MSKFSVLELHIRAGRALRRPLGRKVRLMLKRILSIFKVIILYLNFCAYLCLPHLSGETVQSSRSLPVE